MRCIFTTRNGQHAAHGGSSWRSYHFERGRWAQPPLHLDPAWGMVQNRLPSLMSAEQRSEKGRVGGGTGYSNDSLRHV